MYAYVFRCVGRHVYMSTYVYMYLSLYVCMYTVKGMGGGGGGGVYIGIIGLVRLQGEGGGGHVSA